MNAAVNRSATGTGLNATADAFGNTIGSYQSVAEFAPGIQNSNADLVTQVRRKQAGVKCRPVVLPSASNIFPETDAQCGNVRFAVAHCCDFVAIVVDFDDLLAVVVAPQSPIHRPGVPAPSFFRGSIAAGNPVPVAYTNLLCSG